MSISNYLHFFVGKKRQKKPKHAASVSLFTEAVGRILSLSCGGLWQWEKNGTNIKNILILRKRKKHDFLMIKYSGARGVYQTKLNSPPPNESVLNRL